MTVIILITGTNNVKIRKVKIIILLIKYQLSNGRNSHGQLHDTYNSLLQECLAHLRQGALLYD